MGFLRVSASADGKLKQPLRAGAGFISNLSPTNFDSAMPVTLTVAQISGGAIIQGSTLTGNSVYTLPTSVEINAEWPEMDIGDAFTFYLGNHQTGLFSVVLVPGTGMTVIGINNDLRAEQHAGRMVILIKTSDTTHDLY